MPGARCGRDFAEFGAFDETECSSPCACWADHSLAEPGRFLVLGHLELPAHPELAVGSEFFLQGVPTGDAGDRQRHLAGVAAELAHTAGTGSGGLRGEVLALDRVTRAPRRAR